MGHSSLPSELRALTLYPGIEQTVDHSALAQYLIYEYVPAPNALISGTRKLPAGHCLAKRQNHDAHIEKYWDLPMAPLDSPMRLHDMDEAAERLKEAIARSVKQRLVSDVPLGVFLSGGLDSSIIAASAAHSQRDTIQTFCIRFLDPSYDESAHARHVASAIGSEHHEHTVGAKDLLNLIEDLANLLDEPIGDGSLVPTYLLSSFAKQRVSVALSGDGGDELFGGYPTFQAEAILGSLLHRIPPSSRRAIAEIGLRFAAFLPSSSANFSWEFKIKQLLKGLPEEGVTRHQSWLASVLPEQITNILHRDVTQQRADRHYDIIDQRLKECSSENRWDRLLYFYVKGYLGENVLAKVDRASMQVGLEVRAPFLDREIIEIACNVIPRLRVRGTSTKRVLKRAALGLVPNRTLRRKKERFWNAHCRMASWRTSRFCLRSTHRAQACRIGTFQSRLHSEPIGFPR